MPYTEEHLRSTIAAGTSKPPKSIRILYQGANLTLVLHAASMHRHHGTQERVSAEIHRLDLLDVRRNGSSLGLKKGHMQRAGHTPPTRPMLGVVHIGATKKGGKTPKEMLGDRTEGPITEELITELIAETVGMDQIWEDVRAKRYAEEKESDTLFVSTVKMKANYEESKDKALLYLLSIDLGTEAHLLTVNRRLLQLTAELQAAYHAQLAADTAFSNFTRETQS